MRLSHPQIAVLLYAEMLYPDPLELFRNVAAVGDLMCGSRCEDQHLSSSGWDVDSASSAYWSSSSEKNVLSCCSEFRTDWR